MRIKNIGQKARKTPPATHSVETDELAALEAEIAALEARRRQLAPAKKKTVVNTVLTESMYLQPEEIAALFRVIPNKRDRAIFRIVYHRGLRAHEVGLLQYSDFRERDTVLFVRRGKGSISAGHKLVEEEARVLRAYLKERGAAPGPMFVGRQGNKGITRFRLDQLMKQYCAAAGIEPAKAHMHALKHSCGTHLAERGNSPDAIQDWLGHRDPASTAIYMHFSRRRREESVEKNRDWR